MFVGSLLVTYRSAIGQFFSLSLVTIPKVFANFFFFLVLPSFFLVSKV